ncbi:RNA polymerase, sigma-24 subunit, RpoE [Abditibacterium utsteinense]|uniref:RNA polymerase sigma factor n=1 Tax=Abditibacterium utsteinense TaxID=1960156 RepID=A0A2S8SVQ1_9BACT|nr:sigma-70 family RNA polymerase sigma factor [Abditibacterium utsteinense]PQV64862.1 RNA polymerase, sigma-24 subunit, RpoE [Abditibacterium utsteinense]
MTFSSAMAYPNVWSSEELESDSYLVERTLDGDVAGYEKLVTRYQNKIMGYVGRMTNGDREEAEDITQEAFIKAYRNLDSFRGQASFSTWLYKIATNLCIDRARTRKRRPQQAYSLDEPFDKEENSGGREIADLRFEPSKGVERDELRTLVRQTVSEMPEKQRQVLIMCDLQGMAYENIAEVLDIPLGTVKSRIFHARADLARRLKPYMSGVK